MELFDQNGCLTEEGLHAVIGGQLDELGRLEAAEHLSYCDKCMDRYTALLTADVLEEPPRSARGAVMSTIWVRLMQNTWGRAAVAAVAAVLALTMWRSGTLKQILSTGETVRSWLPETTQTTEPEQLGRPVQDDERTPTQPEQLGKPVQDREPKPTLSQKLTGTLDSLLFGKNESAAEPDAAVSNQKKWGNIYEEKWHSDLPLCLCPGCGPDVSGVHETRTLAHHAVLPVHNGWYAAAGTAGSDGAHRVDVQLF